MPKNILQNIPSIHEFLEEESIQILSQKISKVLVIKTIYYVLNQIKRDVLSKKIDSVPLKKDIILEIEKSSHFYQKQKLQNVINATGVLIHTNLGRSTLDKSLWQEIEDINTGYTNLEFNLNNGKRGKRSSLINVLIQELLHCEDSHVVNNNAASLFLILNSLAKNKEVIVSRSQQVQIGGGFRIPDILREAGAKLVEVGTTNITTVQDYQDAITENTALILIVHTSNFRIRGFFKEPSLKDLKQNINNIPICYDQGSAVIDENIKEEEKLQNLIKYCDLACFSGDKILSSTQAGIIVGQKTLMEKIKKNSLNRIIRLSKTSLSILERSFINRLNGEQTNVEKFLNKTKEDYQILLEKILPNHQQNSYFEFKEDLATIGGGSTPDVYYPSYSIIIHSSAHSAQKIIDFLRTSSPAVIGMLKEDRVHINLAAILEKDIHNLRQILENLNIFLQS